MELTFSQAGTILKALEMNNSDNANYLGNTIFKALNEMVAKSNEINAQLLGSN